jgi:hypothetical protein
MEYISFVNNKNHVNIDKKLKVIKYLINVILPKHQNDMIPESTAKE